VQGLQGPASQSRKKLVRAVLPKATAAAKGLDMTFWTTKKLFKKDTINDYSYLAILCTPLCL
jgi:hypothetical protein